MRRVLLLIFTLNLPPLDVPILLVDTGQLQQTWELHEQLDDEDDDGQQEEKDDDEAPGVRHDPESWRLTPPWRMSGLYFFISDQEC